MQGFGEVVLQLDHIIFSQGYQKAMDISVGEDSQRHIDRLAPLSVKIAFLMFS